MRTYIVVTPVLSYENLVQPILSYGSAIWGGREFSCIKIQNKACRFFLGVGNKTRQFGNPRRCTLALLCTKQQMKTFRLTLLSLIVLEVKQNVGLWETVNISSADFNAVEG